jgi:hypothetical protein
MLTAIQCATAKPLQPVHGASSAKPSKLFDGGGLFLLVMPNGSKLWRLKYRFGGKEKLLSFGAFDLVSLAEGAGKARRRETTLVSRRGPCDGKGRGKESRGGYLQGRRRGMVGEEKLRAGHAREGALAD